MSRLLFLSLLSACNNTGLSSGSPDMGLGCSGQACLATCDQLHDAALCDARVDCYALYSGDLPCDNSSCSNHFVQCVAGAAPCQPTGVCNAACTMLTPTCRDGDVNVFSSSCCSNGCASAAKCPNAVACTSDDQCGPQAYCRGALSSCTAQCQLTIGVAATGVCHRSCVGRDNHCACVDDSDCPGFFTSCDKASGTCMSLQPPVCHATCPAGCSDASDTQFGEICVCNQCP